jgi:DNA repair/transcription protein MET18/MMS19
MLEFLKAASDCAPRIIAEQTLPLLFASLPDSAPRREAIADRERCWQTLSVLRKLCIQQALFESMVVRLMTKLDLLCFPSGDVGSDLEPFQAYAHMILKTLEQTLETKLKAKHSDIAKYIDSLVPRIFNIFVASALSTDKRKMIASDPRLLRVSGGIITLVVQSLPVLFVSHTTSSSRTDFTTFRLRKQQSYAVGLSKAILSGDFTDIAQGFQKILPSHTLLLILSVGSPISIFFVDLINFIISTGFV